MKILIFFFVTLLATCHGDVLNHEHGATNQILPLRVKSGPGGHYIPEVSCASWRLGVEEHNIIWVEPFNATSFNEWADLGTAPALPESQKLYNKLLSLGIKIVFLTGRANKQKNITAKNLRLAGYHTCEKLICKDTSIYHGKTAVTYKSSERKNLEEEGYRIIGNIGDQWSDILGANTGNRTFKLPDPMYYII